MDNLDQQLTTTLREVAESRDRRLREMAIPPEVLARLNDCLAAQFPVETAFRILGRQRDHLLDRERLSVPPRIAETLSERGRSRGIRLKIPSYFGLAAGIALTLGWILVRGHHQALLQSGRSSPPAAWPNTREGSAPANEIFFVDRLDRLSLEATRIELASLQPSRLALSTAYLIEQPDALTGIRLDLPLRQLLHGTESNWGP